jgi:hypothetical protein
MDELDGLRIDNGEGGAQGFMTTGDVVEGLFKCRDIEVAGEAHGEWDVVECRTQSHLFDEPESLLGV